MRKRVMVAMTKPDKPVGIEVVSEDGLFQTILPFNLHTKSLLRGRNHFFYDAEIDEKGNFSLHEVPNEKK